MTLLIAGGDSFTFGCELKDDYPGPSSGAWCNLIAEQNNWQCVNTALGGSSNSSIARKVLNTCENNRNRNIFVCVMWSFPSRYEFRFTYDTNNRDTPWKSVNPWDLETYEQKTKQVTIKDKATQRDFRKNSDFLKSSGMRDFLQYFYKHVGSSDVYEYYQTYKEIVFLQNYCKTNNIPYLFTLCDNITINHSCNDDNVNALHSCIDFDKFFLFDDHLGFDQWAWENKYARGDFHPLDQAHQDAAILIGERIREVFDKN
jgi:hypothetical protein